MSQRWKESRPPPPPPPTRHALPEWPLRGWRCAPPALQLEVSVSQASVMRDLGGVRFHRYKSFRFNPITQEWVVRAQGFCIILVRHKEYAERKRLLPTSDFIQSMFAQQTARGGSLNSNSAIPHLSAHRRRLVIDIVKYLLWQLFNSLMSRMKGPYIHSKCLYSCLWGAFHFLSWLKWDN